MNWHEEAERVYNYLAPATAELNRCYHTIKAESEKLENARAEKDIYLAQILEKETGKGGRAYGTNGDTRKRKLILLLAELDNEDSAMQALNTRIADSRRALNTAKCMTDQWKARARQLTLQTQLIVAALGVENVQTQPD